MPQHTSRGPGKPHGGARMDIRKRVDTPRARAREVTETAAMPVGAGFMALGGGGHVCSFYRRKEDWISLLEAFLEAGISRGEKCVYLVSRGSERRVRESMQGARSRIANAIGARAIELKTLERAYFRGKRLMLRQSLDFWRTSRERAVAEGFSGLRGIIQADRPLGGPATLRGWIAHEYQLDELLSQSGGAMLCLYNRAAQPAGFTHDMLEAHATVAHQGLIGQNIAHVPPDEYRAARAADRRVDRTLGSLSRLWRRELESKSLPAALSRGGGRRLSVALRSLKKDARAIRSLAMQAELARASRAITLGQLMATIAHEVNQPLAALVANAGAGLRWLRGTPPRIDNARQALMRIVRDGNRASDVIARIRALVGKTVVERKPLNLNLVVKEVLVLVKTELRRNGITVRTDLNEKLPAMTCDRVQMQQVLLNLVVNAIEAMGSIRTRPRLLAIGTEADSAGVIVSVKDHGIGVDEEALKRIFEPFYSTKPHGMGIGLAISRSIIEAHGGRIWAVRNNDSGTTFRFRLPSNRADAE